MFFGDGRGAVGWIPGRDAGRSVGTKVRFQRASGGQCPFSVFGRRWRIASISPWSIRESRRARSARRIRLRTLSGWVSPKAADSSRTVAGAMTNYALDGLQALLEKDGTGATQVRYVTGLARIASGSVVYYLEDRLGSVAGLVDANQNVTDTFRYDAWGNLLQQQGTTNPAYQWVGEEGYYLNPDAGLSTYWG